MRLSFIKSVEFWTAVGTVVGFIAFGLSAYNTYVQVWPRHYVTATILGISSDAIEEQSGGWLQQVRVDFALWNRGDLPAVVSDGNLIFAVCPKLVFAQNGIDGKATPHFPIVIAPGKVILESLEAVVSPAAALDVATLNCGESKRRVLYVDVTFQALQSDGKLAASEGPGGELRQGSTSGLHRNDRIGSIGSTAMSSYEWTATDRGSARPISLIPAEFTGKLASSLGR